MFHHSQSFNWVIAMPVLLCVALHKNPYSPSNRAASLTQVPQCSSLWHQWKNLSVFNLEWRLFFDLLDLSSPWLLDLQPFPDLIILSHLKFLQSHFLHMLLFSSHAFSGKFLRETLALSGNFPLISSISLKLYLVTSFVESFNFCFRLEGFINKRKHSLCKNRQFQYLIENDLTSIYSL